MLRSHSLPSPLPTPIQSPSDQGCIAKCTPNALRSRLKRGEMNYIGPTRLDFGQPSPTKTVRFTPETLEATPTKPRRKRSSSLPLLSEASPSRTATWPPGFKPDRVEQDFHAKISVSCMPHSHKFKLVQFPAHSGVLCHICLSKDFSVGRSCTFDTCPRVLCEECVSAKFHPPPSSPRPPTAITEEAAAFRKPATLLPHPPVPRPPSSGVPRHPRRSCVPPVSSSGSPCSSLLKGLSPVELLDLKLRLKAQNVDLLPLESSPRHSPEPIGTPVGYSPKLSIIRRLQEPSPGDSPDLEPPSCSPIKRIKY
jgi:hypothetical protein